MLTPGLLRTMRRYRFRYNKGEADQEVESGVETGANRGTESRLERFVGRYLPGTHLDSRVRGNETISDGRTA